MMILGLTGSIGMGKSEAAKILAAYNLPVFDSDAEVHKLYDSAKGAELIRPFVPEAAFHDKVDRKLLARAIEADPGLLERFEKPVHAALRQNRAAFLNAAKASGAKAVVLDIPLLFETGSESDVDKIIVISSTPELQRARALSRAGMSEERFNLILARQMSDAEKRIRADVVIENNASLEDLKKSLHGVLHKWGI